MPRPSVFAAFRALVDYAGLFPPAQLSLREAQREYATARSGPYAWMLGRFILTGPQLIESVATLAGPFSVIGEARVATLKALAELRGGGAPIEALEIPLRKDVTFDEVSDAVEELAEHLAGAGFDVAELPVFVEVPRSAHWPEIVPRAMSALSAAKLGAKLRCGGVTASAFPTVDEVAEFIVFARKHRVPFKATAGLHHPVRHVDSATGFTMHGFLNLLAAAALAQRVERDTLVRIVAEEDSRAFVFDDRAFSWRDERIAAEELDVVRRGSFVAYGSCSFSEPAEDLVALELLPSQ